MRKEKLIRYLFICLALFTVKTHAEPHPADQHIILVLGDSLSAGYGLPRGTGWVNLLENKLRDLQTEQESYKVVNASVSGETSSGGLHRLPRLLSRQRPAVVLLALGANDGLRGLPLGMTENNLSEMIRISQQSNAKVVLLGVQLPPNYGKIYSEEFKALYPRLAKRYRTSLVPSILAPLTGNQDYWQADRLHPNEKAQPLILKTVWPQLTPLLQK